MNPALAAEQTERTPPLAASFPYDYKRLYAAVLELAINDLRSLNDLRSSRAEAWIFNDPDFCRITRRLGLEPSYVRRKAITIIKQREVNKRTKETTMRISSSGVEAIARDEVRILDKPVHEMTVEELREKVAVMRAAASVNTKTPKVPRAPKEPKTPRAVDIEDIDESKIL